MKEFIHNDFLLDNEYARELYHTYASRQPIIDYHNHLNPEDMAENRRFETISELWLGGDHYKWRALRANGVAERYITGDAPAFEKFMKWASTVPHTMRNPLYHWTHLELKRYFNIDTLLNESTGEEIYAACNEQLAGHDFTTRALLERMNVKVLCTTDDPVDSLEHHRKIQSQAWSVKVLPTWRPDKLLAVDDTAAYNAYIARLEAASNIAITTFDDLLQALRVRRSYFQSMGCRISDHGLGVLPFARFTEPQLKQIFLTLRSGKEISNAEQEIFRAGMLYHLLLMNHEAGWRQQLHIGALRNNNRRLYSLLGPDIGCDSMGEAPVLEPLSQLLGMLDQEDALAPTVFYNLHPKDSEALLSMAYNFNDGSMAGKMQYGAAWWFLDQYDGILKQLNALSHFGLLSPFVGMLTDSRSYLSFPRHEYFRRILCNILGTELEKGRLPVSEIPFIGHMVEDISYHNAVRYFSLDTLIR